MTRAEEAARHALATVAAARALRQREAEERRKTFQRIELASRKPLYVPKGVQLKLDFSQPSREDLSPPRHHS